MRRIYDLDDPRHERFAAPAVQTAERRIDLPLLDFRANVGAANDADRTVDVLWSTGAGVLRVDWNTGANYLEVLSLDKKHVRLDRLNTGAPVLNSHDASTLQNQIGVVVEGSAVLVGPTEARAKLRFSKRDDVEPIFQDIRDKIHKNVSVGYRVYKFEETRGAGTVPTRTAVDWEPFEVSIVAIGADAGAQIRSADTNACSIVVAGPAEALAPRIDTPINEAPIGGDLAFVSRVVASMTRTPPPGLAHIALLTPADRARIWEELRTEAVSQGDMASAEVITRALSISGAESRAS